MNALLNDLRIAFRQLVRQPGFASTVVCTLALTIGATTAVFSVVNTVLVRALAVRVAGAAGVGRVGAIRQSERAVHAAGVHRLPQPDAHVVGPRRVRELEREPRR